MWWLFVVAGTIEIIAGAVSLFAPNKMPFFTQLSKGQGAEAVRWWASAIIALGAGALCARNAPDTDVGKQAVGVAMLVYNVFATVYCLRHYPKAASVGVLVHIPLTAGFLYWLKTTAYF